MLSQQTNLTEKTLFLANLRKESLLVFLDSLKKLIREDVDAFYYSIPLKTSSGSKFLSKTLVKTSLKILKTGNFEYQKHLDQVTLIIYVYLLKSYLTFIPIPYLIKYFVEALNLSPSYRKDKYYFRYLFSEVQKSGIKFKSTSSLEIPNSIKLIIDNFEKNLNTTIYKLSY